jgi:RNA polymerase sigma-70 factor (ECF subfamily)
MPASEEELSAMMRAAISGDTRAYRDFLAAVLPILRVLTRRNLARYGSFEADAEDIVQETLLAIHLKRYTWDSNRPIRSWIAAIARNKLIDALRRRSSQTKFIVKAMEDLPDIEGLPDSVNCPESVADRHELDRMLERLSERQRDIVRSLSLNGASVRETAQRLAMSEGAVRVSLHRALATLASLYRGNAK